MKKKLVISVALAAALLLPTGVVGQTYTYDALGRVSTVIQPNGTKTVYYYDNNDNRTGTQTATSGTTTLTATSSPTVIPVTSGTSLRTLANDLGYTGSSSANYQFVVPAGTTITGVGGYGLGTGTWPTGVTLSLVINGNIYGAGGNGGMGGTGEGDVGSPGYAGSDAIYAQAPISITVNTGGSIKAGGGGGGGGGPNPSFTTGGEGGGGGFPNGLGGLGTSGSMHDGAGPGAPGTTSGGGAGGATGGPSGGAGGNAGAAGVTPTGVYPGAGGAAGYAVRKNGNTVTVTGGGTVTGSVG